MPAPTADDLLRTVPGTYASAANPGAGDPLAATDRLVLMGLWFAFRSE